tara:strand:+ start:204 stop:686 length:483 start_codon:yes stop_codon:yes gene_type:complete
VLSDATEYFGGEVACSTAESADAQVMKSSYTRTQILTSSPAKLRGLLLQRAVQEAHGLRQAVESGDGEQILAHGNLLRRMVLELMSGVAEDVDLELLQHLQGITVYLYRKIGEASGQRDDEAANEVVALLEFEKETWDQATARLLGQDDGASPGQTNLAG